VTAANLESMNCGIALPLMRFQCSLHLRIHGELFVAVCAFRYLPQGLGSTVKKDDEHNCNGFGNFLKVINVQRSA